MPSRQLGPVVASIATFLVLSAPPSAVASGFLHSCAPGDPAQCGRLLVPVDRSGAFPGQQISLSVVREPATGRRTGVTIALAGGPGQSATSLAGDFAASLGPAARHQDVVTFDQRGTGFSGVLRCGEFENTDGFGLILSASLCVQRIGPRIVNYTTRDSVEDIEALRQALGVQRISIYGTSYGTKVALAYAVLYPQHVARLALDSVLPLNGPDPFDSDTYAAIPRVLRELCGRGACAKITHDPVADLTAVLARARADGGQLPGQVVMPSGAIVPFDFGEADIFGMLVTADLDDELRTDIPAALHAAAQGDDAALTRAVRRADLDDDVHDSPGIFSTALFAATTCAETELPWPRSTPFSERQADAQAALAERPATAFAPFDPSTALLGDDTIDLCTDWPESPIDPNVTGTPPRVPTLLLEGEEDLRTPIEGALRVQASIPGSQLVTVAGTGHSTVGSDATGCAQRQLDRFLLGESVAHRCSGIARPLPLAPAVPSSVSAVRPLPGTSGRSGRTLAAVALTLDDVLRSELESIPEGSITFGNPPDGGGLRAGNYVIGNRGTAVNGIVFVPGVRVSGHFMEGGSASGSVFVDGGGAAQGTLRIGPGGFATGRLDGRRVRAQLPLPVLNALEQSTTTTITLSGARGGSARGRRGGSRGRVRVGQRLLRQRAAVLRARTVARLVAFPAWMRAR